MELTLKEWMRGQGNITMDRVMELAEEASFNGVCPALCTEGCEVEPDGECPHGGRSLLLKLGLI
jgi:hypothetical protein